MPERAEIEAVVEAAQAVVDTQAAIVRACTPSDPEFLHAQGANMVPEERDRYAALFSRWHRTTRNLAAALDRVRDARGDDAARLRAAAKRVLEADMRGVRDLDALNALEDAAGFSQQGQRRSPQGEDHEARDEQGRRLYPTILQGEAATAARLAEHPPSRDGTVAVDDVAEWLECRRNTYPYGRRVWKVLDGLRTDFLAEFGPARAGESDEGGNQ